MIINHHAEHGGNGGYKANFTLRIMELYDCISKLDNGYIRTNDFPDYQNILVKKINQSCFYLQFDIIKNKICYVGGNISFKIVEDFISDLEKKYSLKNQLIFTLGTFELNNKSDKAKLLQLKVEELPIVSKNLDEIATRILEYINYIYGDYMQKYSVLQTVNDELIDKVDQMQLSEYIPYQMPLKKMIIMKLCNNPKYEEYVNWLDWTWEEDSKTMDITKDKDYLAYCDLKEILKNGNL